MAVVYGGCDGGWTRWWLMAVELVNDVVTDGGGGSGDVVESGRLL